MSECYCDFDQYMAHVKQMVHITPQRSHHSHLSICPTIAPRFQQDGVMTHSKFSSTNVVQILWWPYCFFRLVVPLISGPTLLDLCIWGFLKENIHKNSLHMFEEMKQIIQLCTSSITEETYHQVTSNLRKSKCMYCCGWLTFSAPNITLFVFWLCQ